MLFPLHPDDTIAAVASPAGHAARGIVRVSGAGTPRLLESLFVPAPESAGDFPRRVPWCHRGALRVGGVVLPVPVDLYFWPNGRSYTGQPLAELHAVSSPPLLEAILSELFARGVRPAEPGEFTLRAFLAGRIDLTQAEAVLGVIDAGTERELQTALDQLAGGLASQIVRLRGDLLDLLADLEAGLDFADEAIEFVSPAALAGRLTRARDGIGDLLVRANQRMRPAPRARVVLAGPPNAGKSTLFNALAGSAAALVSEVAGTTRDYLTAEATVGGLAVTLVDTAGEDSRVDGDGIALEAQRRRREQIAGADLVLWCRPADGRAAAGAADDSPAPEDRLLPVVTKIDLTGPAPSRAPTPAVSARSGAGMRELAATIVARLSMASAGSRQLVGTTAARSHDSLLKAQAALDRALTIAETEADQELLAIEVRETLDELGKIAGAVYTDDILDRIFSRFCIGK